MTKRMGSGLTKLMLAAGVGIILAAIGYLVWVFVLSPNDTAASAGETAANLTTTRTVAGRNIILQGDAADRLVLQREAGGSPAQTATAVPTPAPGATTAPATDVPPTAVPATAVPPTAVPPTAVPPAVGQFVMVEHLVAAGDTLFSIAQRYNTSITALAEHGIASTSLQPGAVIRVPVANLANCSSGRAHVVEEGENVFRLAIRYGTTKERLAEINGLPANYLIRAGSVLCLP